MARLPEGLANLLAFEFIDEVWQSAVVDQVNLGRVQTRVGQYIDAVIQASEMAERADPVQNTAEQTAQIQAAPIDSVESDVGSSANLSAIPADSHHDTDGDVPHEILAALMAQRDAKVSAEQAQRWYQNMTATYGRALTKEEVIQITERGTKDAQAVAAVDLNLVSTIAKQVLQDRNASEDAVREARAYDRLSQVGLSSERAQAFIQHKWALLRGVMVVSNQSIHHPAGNSTPIARMSIAENAALGYIRKESLEFISRRDLLDARRSLQGDEFISTTERRTLMSGLNSLIRRVKNRADAEDSSELSASL